jgi:hypothetical protein
LKPARNSVLGVEAEGHGGDGGLLHRYYILDVGFFTEAAAVQSYVGFITEAGAVQSKVGFIT